MKLKSVIEESWLNSKRDGDTPKLTKEQKADIMSKIGQYNKYSKAIYNENDLIEIAKELSELAEGAELITLSETEDQFDKITVSRNMKDLKNLSGQFQKAAGDAQAFKQRLTGLYEDMGIILNRYFDINEELNDEDNIDDVDKKIIGAKASVMDADAKMPKSKAQMILKKAKDIEKI